MSFWTASRQSLGERETGISGRGGAGGAVEEGETEGRERLADRREMPYAAAAAAERWGPGLGQRETETLGRAGPGRGAGT